MVNVNLAPRQVGNPMSEKDREAVERINQELGAIDADKRKTLEKMIVGAIYVAPVVTSFAINKMAFGPALAQVSNSS